jgi:MoxR-like ATPase
LRAHTLPLPTPTHPRHAPPGLENDEYVRQTEGYLPTAEVAFVDEIFKANSAILNALLTLLNERLFDNGHQRLNAPLMCLVGASNELPESEELDALYDRFLLRRSVAQVSNSQVRARSG